MQFYVLEKTPSGVHESARTDAHLVNGFKLGEAPRCETCGQFTGMRPWLPPFRVELEAWGNEFGDFAFLNVGTDVLVSLRFKKLWEQLKLVGLSGFEPVQVVKIECHRKTVGDSPPYFRAIVPRSSTKINFAVSEFEWSRTPTCSTCFVGDIKRWSGIEIDEGSWTGEDVFVARGLPGKFIASERLKDVCESNNVTNAVLLPAETYGHDFYPWEHRSPLIP